MTAEAAIAAFGQSYASTTDFSGIRDVSGLNNNLLKVNAEWGAVDQPFVRTVPANYANYTQAVAPGVTGSYGNKNGGFDLNYYAPGVQYAAATNYTPVVTGSGETAIVALQNVVDYTPRMISRTTTTAGATPLLDADNHIVNWDPARYENDAIYMDLVDGYGVDISTLVEGAAIITNYGLLETLGHKDYQKTPGTAGSDEFFIGAENPGVAPTNGWFALFGQFFDHGLDFVDKSSGKTIKIALAVDDPLYGVIGPDGRPATSITITRATPQGVDANGDVAYVNHTSPFIDQSQTYGSHLQMTNLLREWVSHDGGETYQAGMELFDGHTLETAWKRPDGVMTTQTLPTLSELRDHVLDTNRDALSWEDVLNYRNRDANGGIATGLSGQTLLLDMNPRFDGEHLDATTAVGSTTVAALVDAAVGVLNASLAATITSMPGFAALNPTRTGGSDTFTQDPDGQIVLHLSEDLVIATGPTTSMTIPGGSGAAFDYTGANALMLWVNFANFSITAPPRSCPRRDRPDSHGRSRRPLYRWRWACE